MILDWTAIGSIATAAAVAVALGWEPLRKWWNAPKLRILGPVRGNASLLMIRNIGNDAAHRVEVTVSDVCPILKDGKIDEASGFIALHLAWTHTETPVCEFLPGGSQRFCTFGTLQAKSRKDEVEYLFTLGSIQAPASGRNELYGRGHYLIRVVASAVNCKPVVRILEMNIGRPPSGLDVYPARPDLIAQMTRFDRKVERTWERN
jgi:hypothetical protein